MSEDKRPGERDRLTWKEHLFLAVGCLAVCLLIVWVLNNFGGWID